MRPASVSVPFFDVRSNSCSPSSISRRRTAWLTAGCVRCTFAAAREKLRSWATARKILSAPRSIIGPYPSVIIITLTSSLRPGYNSLMSPTSRVTIFDTTLRDGEQAPGFSLDVPSKLTMARALDAVAVGVIEAVIAAGCTTVNLPDTVGYATPDELREFFADIIGRVPNADRAVFSTHCHDDLGLAVANSLAALQGGVRQIECTVNGIGERAGNASLEELVMALRIRQDRLPYDTGIRSPLLFDASQLLSTLTTEPVQANK